MTTEALFHFKAIFNAEFDENIFLLHSETINFCARFLKRSKLFSDNILQFIDLLTSPPFTYMEYKLVKKDILYLFSLKLHQRPNDSTIFIAKI